jgi:hypothetical protein
MKTIFTIIAFLTLSIGFSQSGELTGKITENSNIGFPGLTVKLTNKGRVISETQTDFDGKYSFKNIPSGIYLIRISGTGMREETVENILIENQIHILSFRYPKPCVAANKKVCPNGHKNNIIPIVYGFPSKKTMKKWQKGKIKLGGCNPFVCEKWHCVEHDLDF